MFPKWWANRKRENCCQILEICKQKYVLKTKIEFLEIKSKLNNLQRFQSNPNIDLYHRYDYAGLRTFDLNSILTQCKYTLQSIIIIFKNI